MTQVKYKCRGEDSPDLVWVNTLPQAQEFVKQHGGTYELVYITTRSDDEAVAGPNARARLYGKMH